MSIIWQRALSNVFGLFFLGRATQLLLDKARPRALGFVSLPQDGSYCASVWGGAKNYPARVLDKTTSNRLGGKYLKGTPGRGLLVRLRNE